MLVVRGGLLLCFPPLGSLCLLQAEFAITMAIAAVIWSTFYYILGSVLGRTVPLVLALVADVLDDVPRWVLVVSVLILLAYLGAAATGLKIRQIRLRRHRRPRHLRHLRHLRKGVAR
jgi:predicted membrane-bound spermidine synthase